MGIDILPKPVAGNPGDTEGFLQTRNAPAGNDRPIESIDSSMRTHCLDRSNCKAAKPTTHCRRCSALRLRNDPAMEAKRLSAVARYHADPAVKAELATRIVANAAKAMEHPSQREKMREHGRRQARDYLHRADIRARAMSPESRAKAGRAISDTVLAWCPVERRAEYRRMVVTKHIPAAEARAIIEAEIAGTPEHGKRAVANAGLAMRLKHEREVAGRY